MSEKKSSDSYSLQVKPATMRGDEITINGYKHAMVQVICAAVATGGRVCIKNAPGVDDTQVMADIFCAAQASAFADNGYVFDASGYADPAADPILSRKIHGSLYLMPALAVRFGRFVFGQAGGCQIGDGSGARPVQHMLSVMEKFGIRCTTEGQQIIGERVSEPTYVRVNIRNFSESDDQLTGAQISGATKTALLCALGCEHTVIEDAYTKTDVQDLVRYIREIGRYTVNVQANRIEILMLPGKSCAAVDFYLADCVSEVMTYIALAVHKQLNLALIVQDSQRVAAGLQHELAILHAMGVQLKMSPTLISVNAPDRVQPQSIEVTNDSIQSDHHPFFTLMLLRGTGPSTIVEHVWRDRFAYVPELNRLGADILREGNAITIEPSSLHRGDQVLRAADTRAAAICLLAALSASGPTTIESCAHMDRGYANLVPTLSRIGAEITKVASDEAWGSAA